MADIAQETLSWCDQQRNKLNSDDMIKNVLAVLESSHENCGKKCCGGFGDDAKLISSGVAQQLLSQFSNNQQNVDHVENDFD